MKMTKIHHKKDPLAILVLVAMFLAMISTALVSGTARNHTGPLHGTLIGFILFYVGFAIFILGGLYLLRRN